MLCLVMLFTCGGANSLALGMAGGHSDTVGDENGGEDRQSDPDPASPSNSNKEEGGKENFWWGNDQPNDPDLASSSNANERKPPVATSSNVIMKMAAPPRSSGPNITFTMTPDPRNLRALEWKKDTELKYTLVIANEGSDLVGTKNDSNVKIKFQDTSDTIKPDVKAQDISSTGLNVERDGDGVKISCINGGLAVMPAGSTVTINFTVKINADAANAKSFNMKIYIDPKNISGNDNWANSTITFTQNGDVLTSDYGSVNNFAPTGGYTLVYHLNAPGIIGEGSTDICTVTQTDSATFTLKSVGDSTSTIFPDNGQKDNLIKGQYGVGGSYFFAGWSTSKLSVSTPYNQVDYPVWDFDKTDKRGVGDVYTVDVPPGVPLNLYAVWTTRPGLFGYVLKENKSDFKNNGQTADGQKIYKYGTTSSGAPKYIVYDGGYETGDDGFTVTTETPDCAGKTFLAWFNKSPYKASGEKYVVMGGDDVTFGGENNIYSLDAVWGALSAGENVSIKYDGAEHSIKFAGNAVSPGVTFTNGGYDGEANTAYTNTFSESKITYTYSVKKENGTDVMLGLDGKPNESGSKTTNVLPKFKEPGTYKYTVTAMLHVPEDYTSNANAKAGIKVGETTATLTIEPAGLTYHTNLGNGYDAVSVDNVQAVNGSYTYSIKQLGQAFKESDFGGLTVNLTDGHVSIGGQTYYFAGWSGNKDAKNYDQIEYRVSVYEKDGSKSVRLLADGLKLTTTEIYKDLYAVWTTKPALLGYTMTIKSGDFNAAESTSPVKKVIDGSIKLGDNGTAQNGAQKYVVLNEGYDYTTDMDTPISVVNAVPEDNTHQYKFVAWYNKKSNVEANKDGYNTHNTGDPYILPGGTIYFGNTNTVFSLDAVWAKVSANNKRVTYDGTGYGLDTAVIEMKGGDSTVHGLTGKYVVIVTQNGAEVGRREGTLDNFSALALPGGFINAGKYDYDIKITFADGSGSTAGAQAGVIETKSTLIIDPVLELSVQKELNGRTWKDGEYFDFTLSGGEGASLGNTSTTVRTQGGTASFGQIHFSKDGAYTFTVSEKKGSEAGMDYAASQSTTVNVTWSADGPAAIKGCDSTDGNVYKKTLQFTNTYKSGTLIVQKVLTEGGNTLRDFRLMVSLDDPTINGTYGGITFTNGNADFTLKGGERVTIPGLPAGVAYSVAERWETGYVTTYENCDGTIPDDGIAVTATVTNTYRGGSLKVSKTVDGDGADTSQSFSFTVTLSDTGVNGPRGPVTFKEGVASFQLNGGESKEIPGLPEGVEYTVSEEPVEQYAVIATGAVGTIEYNKTQEAHFINRYSPGSLTVTKNVTGRGADTGKAWNFIVTLSDKSVTGNKGDMEFENGVARITLINGGSVTATDMPTVTYTVEETEANTGGYATTSTGATGSITQNDTACTAAFINRFKTGNLTVSKKVAGDYADKNRQFQFTVSLAGEGSSTINGQYGDMTFSGGVASINLRDGESMLARGLPAGLTYTVTETATDFYTADSTGASGTIEDQKTAATEFTNTYHNGGLAVTKTVEGEFADKEREWNFTVTLTGSRADSITGVYGDMTFRGGKAELRLQDGGKATAAGLPAGLSYKVEEAEADQNGYSTKATGAEGSIPDGGTATAAFTNEFKAGNLTVKKELPFGGNIMRDWNFTVELTGAGSSITGKYGDMNFRNGKAAFTLKGGEKKTAKGLPAGVRYSVTEAEASADSYETTYADSTGMITDEHESVATISNRYPAGNLTVTKLVTGPNADLSREFHFTVDLNDEYINGPRGDMIFVGGVAEFTLKNGESVTAQGLLDGLKYTVTETEANQDGYVTSAQNAAGTIKKYETAEASFTNYFASGGLTVTNKVTGTGADMNKEWNFTVTLTGRERSAINGKYGDMTFENGVAQFMLKDGGRVTAVGLPAGTIYAVVEAEADQDGYETTSSGENGTIQDGVTAEAPFINRKDRSGSSNSGGNNGWRPGSGGSMDSGGTGAEGGGPLTVESGPYSAQDEAVQRIADGQEMQDSARSSLLIPDTGDPAPLRLLLVLSLLSAIGLLFFGMALMRDWLRDRRHNRGGQG